MGGGGGLGLFVNTIGGREAAAFASGKLVAAAAQVNSATDAGGAVKGTAQAPLKPWNRNKAIEHLQREVKPKSGNKCAEFVRKAIEAGGIRLNRKLNTAENSASGYGPILEHAGFKKIPPNTKLQAGDVVIFPPSREHPDGHAAMYSGKKWISDFEQRDIYASRSRRKEKTPYTLYRRP